ncbi:MAG TPA: hypothetical protein VGH74_22135 [Planctomycetaceae bacterium]|jgi:hypothetical protein
MLNVYLTVDSELSPTNFRRGMSLQDDMDVSFYGRTSRGSFGVPYQMDILDEHGLKGMFFVEALFASCVGLEPLREMVGVIRDRGHDVQLHIHPEWLPATAPRLLPGRSGLNMHCFSEDEQVALIRQGRDNLRAAGVSKVSAFRAGNMGADPATLRALARTGIACDSSYFAPYLQSHCRLASLGDICQPVSSQGILELPVTSFQDFPGHFRPLQLCACSSSEMEYCLWEAVRLGWQSVVVLWHSFELIKRPDSKRRAATPAHVVIQRFERLCRFLSRHSDEFQSTTLAQPAPIPRPVANSQPILKSSLWRTAWRMAEQAAGAVV